MKITKRQLRRIIKEERIKLLTEEAQDAINPLIQFGQAWSGLGSAVQEQIAQISDAWERNDEEVLSNINLNAVDMAHKALVRPLNTLAVSDDLETAHDLLEALQWAKGL